jgi:hypothetical protein
MLWGGAFLAWLPQSSYIIYKVETHFKSNQQSPFSFCYPYFKKTH